MLRVSFSYCLGASSPFNFQLQSHRVSRDYFLFSFFSFCFYLFLLQSKLEVIRVVPSFYLFFLFFFICLLLIWHHQRKKKIMALLLGPQGFIWSNNHFWFTNFDLILDRLLLSWSIIRDHHLTFFSRCLSNQGFRLLFTIDVMDIGMVYFLHGYEFRLI